MTNANVYEIDGVDWRRKGIGMAMYDVLERDVLAAQGQGLEPHWGSMSDEAVRFWEARRPEWKGKLTGLNRLGVMASGEVGADHGARREKRHKALEKAVPGLFD